MQPKNLKSKPSNVEAWHDVSSTAVDWFYAARALKTPVWVFDIEKYQIVYANQSACRMWQAENEEELCARDFSKDMSKAVEQRNKQFQTDFEQGSATFHERWTFYPNGSPLSANVVFSGFRLPDGRIAMRCEVIGHADRQPDNLRSAEALMHTDVMIALFELEGAPLYLNPAARNTFGGVANSLEELFVEATDYRVMMFDLDGDGTHRMVAKTITDAGECWFDLSSKLCKDAVTGRPAVLVTAIDVSELKTARDTARFLADRDQLTGCFNRAFLQRHIEGLVIQNAGPQALLYFDVDNFKQVNDTFGHEAGDDVLKELAMRAQSAVTEDDYVVRLGGDEFVILLCLHARQGSVAQLVAAIFDQLSVAISRGATTISATVSGGVTEFEPSAITFEATLQQADLALYRAKAAGRDRFVFYTSEMGNAAQVRQEREAEIRGGLRKREFLLHYQPRLDLRSNKVVSMEGLVCWQHPELGVLPPSEFIPICEETGIIEALGHQVLDMGFEQAMQWQDNGEDLQLSLNISPRQFSDNRLLDFLGQFARVPNFPTQQIELEITENVLIGELDAIAAKLKTISEWGYKIAIDDFGTGYSNLSYISRFPLSCLKIDQSFIQQLPHTGPIVGLIIALGKQIGATIVAEGVETQEQFDWLAQNDCDQIQGYLISKPAALVDLEAFVPDRIAKNR